MDTRTELHITLAAATAFALFAAALAWAVGGRGDTFLALVFGAGAMGATAANFRHLPGDEARAAAAIVGEPSPARAYGSIVVGGVLGFSMYALCVTGLLAGTLFPAFVGGDAKYSAVQAFVQGMRPATNLDAAKALVWAFVAGWYRGALPAFLSGLLTRGANRAAEPAGTGTTRAAALARSQAGRRRAGAD